MIKNSNLLHVFPSRDIVHPIAPKSASVHNVHSEFDLLGAFCTLATLEGLLSWGKKQRMNSTTGKNSNSFEWSQFKIVSPDSNIRTTLCKKINMTMGKYCAVVFV